MLRIITKCALLCCLSISASANTVEIEFDGAITQIQTFDGGLGFPTSQWGISIGHSVTGSMSYDSDAPPVFVDPNFAFYSPDATFNLASEAITINGSAGGTGTGFFIENDQFSSSIGADADTLNFSLNQGLTFSGSVAPDAGFELSSVSLFLRTQDLTLVDSFDLPAFSGVLSDPNIADLFDTSFVARFDFRKTVGDFETATFIAGLNTVTFSSSAVPTPTTFLLFCLAIAGLFYPKRRRSNKANLPQVQRRIP